MNNLSKYDIRALAAMDYQPRLAILRERFKCMNVSQEGENAVYMALAMVRDVETSLRVANQMITNTPHDMWALGSRCSTALLLDNILTTVKLWLK